MLATIWMRTQEWSLISSRTTAFTFETCHQAFTCLSSLTRSSSFRSFRLPRTGKLTRILSTAWRRAASRARPPRDGASIRSSVSLSRSIRCGPRRCARTCRAASGSSRGSRSGQRWSTTVGTVKSARSVAVEVGRLKARA